MFIGFCIGFVVVVALFVKLVMIWLSVLEHIDEDKIVEEEIKMISQTWEDGTQYYGYLHEGLPDGLGIAN